MREQLLCRQNVVSLKLPSGSVATTVVPYTRQIDVVRTYHTFSDFEVLLIFEVGAPAVITLFVSLY